MEVVFLERARFLHQLQIDRFYGGRRVKREEGGFCFTSSSCLVRNKSNECRGTAVVEMSEMLGD